MVRPALVPNLRSAPTMLTSHVLPVLFEVPSNMVMKAWRPSMWLPTIMIAWGAVMVSMGFVKNFEGLLVARIFLGITEAGLFPGVSFFLTQWYRRYEINFRIAMFFSAATAAGAFGGLLARVRLNCYSCLPVVLVAP